MAERLVKVAKLTSTLRYGNPRKAYGPGTNLKIPKGLADSLGLKGEEIEQEEAASAASGVSGGLDGLGLTEKQIEKLEAAGIDSRDLAGAASDDELSDAGLTDAAIKRMREHLEGGE